MKSLRPKNRRRAAGVAVGVALLLVTLVVGLAFANAIGAGRVANNARSLHWANASLGTASLTRAALVQAATFTELETVGLASGEDADVALGEAQDALELLQELEAAGGNSPSLAFLTPFLVPVDRALTALGEGRIADAESLIKGDVENSYQELIESLRAELDAVSADIEANTAGSRRAADLVRFFLLLAIPASAVLIYRYIAKRQVRELQIKADSEIEAERAVGRAKDDFIAGLSHELRTPLTSIYGFAEVLSDGEVGDPSATREIAQIIANESAELNRMVDDLLAAARMESTGVGVEMTATDLDEIVESAITPYARAGLTVKRERSGEVVWTDAARLRHILVNMLSNAARHGGPEVGIEVSSGDQVVEVEVWDNGPGVPEEQEDKLFQRFVHDGSESLLAGSLGLGLAIASRLAGLLGGGLTYQRLNGKTYFAVSVPKAAADGDDGEDAPVSGMIRALSE